jgi:hypothetical protein
MDDKFTLEPFHPFTWKTVKTVNQISPLSITAMKCGANEILQARPRRDPEPAIRCADFCVLQYRDSVTKAGSFVKTYHRDDSRKK